MLATMSASEPLPVETLVAVIDPVVSRELLTWLLRTTPTRGWR